MRARATPKEPPGGLTKTARRAWNRSCSFAGWMLIESVYRRERYRAVRDVCLLRFFFERR